MPAGKSDAKRCGGSIYLYVLATSFLISVIGLGSLAAVRIQLRSARLMKDSAEARACANSAIELGLLYVKQDPNWRTTRPNGTWVQDQALGAGRFSLQGVDPGDNILSNSKYEPLVLTGTGTKGTTRHKVQVSLSPVIEPLEALNTCLHASGSVHVTAGNRIVVVGGPVSTNGQLDNEGTLDGDAHAQSVNRTGTITGVFTLPAPNKAMPDAGVMADYVRRATSVPYTAIIDKAVLSPQCNPWGPVDPNGLYCIDTNGADLTIRNTRIQGTLIVKAVGRTVTVDSAVFFQNYRSDFPVLLVEGNVIIQNLSCDVTLSEATNSTNYNPVGAPYQGVFDTDQLDVYPNEIRGLIYVAGTLTLRGNARIVGAVICDGAVTCSGANTVVHDAALYTSPPSGYTWVSKMKIDPHGWKQIID